MFSPLKAALKMYKRVSLKIKNGTVRLKPWWRATNYLISADLKIALQYTKNIILFLSILLTVVLLAWHYQRFYHTVTLKQ